MLAVHDTGHEPTEWDGQNDEHSEVQDVLNCSAHDLRITPHQNVDVVDQQADARDAYDRDQDVHVTAPSENHGWHPSPSAWEQ